MQEEVTNRSVNFAITGTKLTGRMLMKGLRMYLNHHAKVKAKKTAKRAAKENEIPHGKQTVKELIGQGQGVSTIPVADTELKGFERVAKKYGVDFAIRKDSSVVPPRYTVFFKARDADALTAAYKEYSAQTMINQKRPSVLKQLKKLVERAAAVPRKVREKSQERDL